MIKVKQINCDAAAVRMKDDFEPAILEYRVDEIREYKYDASESFSINMEECPITEYRISKVYNLGYLLTTYDDLVTMD